jgi:hypothetical protein
MHQTVAGSPSLKSDREYVFCVWKAPSGTNYLIGLSQGLFEVRTNSAGETILTRGPVSAELLDAASSAPSNNGITVTMKSLVSRIGQVSPQ